MDNHCKDNDIWRRVSGKQSNSIARRPSQKETVDTTSQLSVSMNNLAREFYHPNIRVTNSERPHL